MAQRPNQCIQYFLRVDYFKLKCGNVPLGKEPQSLGQVNLVVQFTYGSKGDVQKSQVISLAVSRAAFDNIRGEGTETAARRICDISPNNSSFGNFIVSRYTSTATSSANSNALSFVWSRIFLPSVFSLQPIHLNSHEKTANFYHPTPPNIV